MLHKTRGIVFHVTDFSDTGLVARIYTEQFGIQSYMLKGARRKRSKFSPGSLQPLSLLEMEVYRREHGGLQYAAEIVNRPAYSSIPFHMAKSSVTLFLNEVVYKAIREEEANPLLFDFLHHALRWLDAAEPLNPDFHLLFLVQLSRFLGFFPQRNYSAHEPCFDLQEGRFISGLPPHGHFMDPAQGALFAHLLQAPLQVMESLPMSSAIRNELTAKLLEYYSLHLSGFGNIKSHAVLETVWS